LVQLLFQPGQLLPRGLALRPTQFGGGGAPPQAADEGGDDLEIAQQARLRFLLALSFEEQRRVGQQALTHRRRSLAPSRVE
jgi:hypothetical protein